MTKRNILIEADKLLLKHEVTELPLTFETLKRIANRSGWLLAAYQNSGKLLKACGAEEIARKYPAFTMRYDGKVLIFYDEEIPYEDKVRIICHEFGHIVLDHTADDGVIGSNRDCSVTAVQESEADDFAAEMLAPACVMKGLGVLTADKLMKTGLLTPEQALQHIDNIQSCLPLTAAEKTLCDRLAYKRKSVKVKAIIAGTIITTAIIAGFGIINHENSLEDVVIPTNEITVTSPTTSEIPHTAEEQETVYISAHGKKYHKPECYHIAGKNNLIELTIEQAEQAGYEPCKDCF